MAKYTCDCNTIIDVNSGVEQFIGRFPEHVNMIKMDDGHTALHIAAANDHLDIVSLLCSLVGGS